jgi:hypothetical protein
MTAAITIIDSMSGIRIERGFGNFFLARKLVTGSNSIASRIAKKIGRTNPLV